MTAELTGERLRRAGFEWPVIDEAYINRFMSVIEAGQAERRTKD
jgi:hypothetical protein